MLVLIDRPKRDVRRKTTTGPELMKVRRSIRNSQAASMPNKGRFHKLIFEYGFDERSAFEARARGYLSHVAVELDNGCRYLVVFYDLVRLQQDLAEESQHGQPFIAEPGMIIVDEVTEAKMVKAATKFANGDFFDSLRAIAVRTKP